MKPIRIVCSTRLSLEEFSSQSALGRSLALQDQRDPFHTLLFPGNHGMGLASLYNSAIERAGQAPAILVFVHDDVYLCDFFWREKFRTALTCFDVIGLAGNTRRAPRQPAWSFIDENGTWDQPAFLSGSVGHGKGFPCDIISYFGPSGQPCKLLDGLLLAADSTRLLEANLKFDEQFAFHFYDMDFCRQAELRGLAMGTWPISVVHESVGSFGTPQWIQAYQRYLSKYPD
jgi:hypothetical protein